MSIKLWLIYITFVLLATGTPGPAVVFIMTKSLIYGWQKALFAALGNITGLFCLGVIAMTGVGTILSKSLLLFSIIKYLGAAYLIFIGIKQIFIKNKNLNMSDITEYNLSRTRIYFQAFGVAISNPKAIVFLTALFPQFIDISTPIIPQFAILILTLMFFSFCCLNSYSLLAHLAKDWVTKSERLNLINRISGSIFIGFGLLLATSSNK